jgi:hypothetical protein
MLTFLTVLQLVLYIALLALLGQGILYVLAGEKRETNFFYQLLRILSKPFTVPVRAMTPPRVADRHVPILTFALLALVYVVVTIERVKLCVAVGVEVCK